MAKLKKLFLFLRRQLETTGISPKWSGLISIAGTILLSLLLIKLALVAW